MSRTQFTFYESWHRAVSQLKKKAEQADTMNAICKYALYEEEPDISGPPAAVFESIRPALDAARKKSENGKKGKGKAKTNESKTEEEESKEEASTRNSTSTSNRNRTICYPSSLPQEEKREGRPSGRFSPPSVGDVSAFVREKGYHINPEAFVSFYESKGWKIGKEPMQDWQAAVRTWEKREKEKGGQNRGTFGGYHGEDIPNIQADVRA